MFSIATPSSEYLPPVGTSRQPMMDIRVLFPEPEGPMIATISPSSIVNVVPFKAYTSPSPIGNVFVRFSTWIILPSSSAENPDGVPSSVIISLTQLHYLTFLQIACHRHTVANDLAADNIHAPG